MGPKTYPPITPMVQTLAILFHIRKISLNYSDFTAESKLNINTTKLASSYFCILFF